MSEVIPVAYLVTCGYKPCLFSKYYSNSEGPDQSEHLSSNPLACYSLADDFLPASTNPIY